MLFNVDNGKEVKHMPHKEEWERRMTKLDMADYNAIIGAIHNVLDRVFDDKGVVTSSYVPGKDWRGTPYQPIFSACGENWDEARLFFGQLFWRAVQLHPEKWYFVRQERNDDRPIGMTYFRCRDC